MKTYQKYLILLLVVIPAAFFLAHNHFFTVSAHSPVQVKDTQSDAALAPVNKLYGRIKKAVPIQHQPLRLLGTFIGKSSAAYIVNRVSGQAGLYAVGDTVGNARIVEIRQGEIVLQQDHQREVLALDTSTGETIAQEKASDEAITVSPLGVTISRSAMVKDMEKCIELLRTIKIVPVAQPSSAQLEGFRVDCVPPGSIIDKIGIKSGDVVYSVQGQRLCNTKQALQAFQMVKKEPAIQVTLLRDKQLVTLNWKIVD